MHLLFSMLHSNIIKQVCSVAEILCNQVVCHFCNPRDKSFQHRVMTDYQSPKGACASAQPLTIYTRILYYENKDTGGLSDDNGAFRTSFGLNKIISQVSLRCVVVHEPPSEDSDQPSLLCGLIFLFIGSTCLSVQILTNAVTSKLATDKQCYTFPGLNDINGITIQLLLRKSTGNYIPSRML